MGIGYYIISISLGLIPEVAYFTLFFIKLKEIKNKRFLLSICMIINYLILIMLNNYVLINYIIFTTLFFIILKLLYKEKVNIVDLFFIVYSEIYLSLISYVCFRFVKEDFSNYYFMLVVNKILLIVPFLFFKHIKIFYNKYCKFWNRNNNEHRPIKSITLRNISLIILNSFISISYFVFIYINSIAR